MQAIIRSTVVALIAMVTLLAVLQSASAGPTAKFLDDAGGWQVGEEGQGILTPMTDHLAVVDVGSDWLWIVAPPTFLGDWTDATAVRIILIGDVDGVRYPVQLEISGGGNSALFKGDHKIVFNRAPLGDNSWHLFNIKTDPGETQDLAGIDPERLSDMVADYASYVRDNKVLPMPEGYIQSRQIFQSGRN